MPKASTKTDHERLMLHRAAVLRLLKLVESNQDWRIAYGRTLLMLSRTLEDAAREAEAVAYAEAEGERLADAVLVPAAGGAK